MERAEIVHRLHRVELEVIIGAEALAEWRDVQARAQRGGPTAWWVQLTGRARRAGAEIDAARRQLQDKEAELEAVQATLAAHETEAARAELGALAPEGADPTALALLVDMDVEIRVAGPLLGRAQRALEEARAAVPDGGQASVVAIELVANQLDWAARAVAEVLDLCRRQVPDQVAPLEEDLERLGRPSAGSRSLLEMIDEHQRARANGRDLARMESRILSVLTTLNGVRSALADRQATLRAEAAAL